MALTGRSPLTNSEQSPLTLWPASNGEMPRPPETASDTWEVERGSDFQAVYQLRDENDLPYPVTNAAVIGQLRPSEESPTVLLEMSTANGGSVASILPNTANGLFVLDAPTATLTGNIPAAISKALSKNGVMSVQLVWPDGTRYTFFKVCVNFRRGSTRSEPPEAGRWPQTGV